MQRGILIFCLALVTLGIGIDRTGIASAYSDPIGHLRAQDESTYANAAIGLADHGGWLTPKVMGRFLLYKPPLLVWLTAFSLKIFGTSLFALRLPALLASALASTLVFLWSGCDGARSWVALLLLLSNPLWHAFARLCYTDMLLAAAFTAAMFLVNRDPKLERASSILAFAACTAAAVMAKNVAGLLPLFVLFVYAVLPGQQVSFRRIALLCGVTILLVAPWHVYQFVVHRDWFWADYVGVQILGFGMKPPAQNALEGHLAFYAKRLARIDPILVLIAVGSFPLLVRDCWNRRSPQALLLVCWLAAVLAALMAFRFRNLPYALSLIPVLVLMAARPLKKRIFVAVLCVIFAVKVFFPDRVWGLPFGAAPEIPEAPALRHYWELGRSNELILIAPADEFYSFNLPGLKVRYCLVDPDGIAVSYAPHYASLGITVTGDQFVHLDELRPEYQKRLRAWGLDSAEPIASAIMVRSTGDALKLVQEFPQVDFEVPEDWLNGTINRVAVPSAPGRVFLLARNAPEIQPVQRPHLPTRW